jgi:hypothetical protein
MAFLEQDTPILRSIISASGEAVIPVNGMATVGLFIALTGVTSANFSFEASIDGGATGNWYAVHALRTNGHVVETTTGVISATPTYGFVFDVSGSNWFRVRATAGTFGTAACLFAPSLVPRPFQNVMGGVQPRDSATAGNPLYIATGRNANLSGITPGRMVDLWADLSGKLVNKSFAPAELDFRYVAAADASPFNAIVATQVVAAVATYRNYITGLQAVNVGGTATEFVLQDSTGTPSILFRTLLPANMTTPVDFTFQSPLRSGSGTASRIDARCVTAGASIHLSLQGFAGL